MPIGSKIEHGIYDKETNKFIFPDPDPLKVMNNRQSSKIDVYKLHEFIKQGKKPSWIAKHFGCSRAAVTKRVQSMKKMVVKEAASVAPDIMAREIHTVDQLCRINRTANALLDSLQQPQKVKKIDDVTGDEYEVIETVMNKPELLIKTMAEIRNQLRFQLEIFQTLTDTRAVKEFQETVIEVINSINPEVKNQIIKALQRKNALRAALEFNR